ncbi:MAG: serine hydrolase [Anaeroplasmataceae bacterium]|nr:serine hydrolase [Anaeroplasmataceae bacterium]
MKKAILFLSLLFSAAIPTQAITNTDSSYIVMEATTNRILEGNNLNKQYLVASTAKIMTAITAIEYYKIDEQIKVTREDTLEVGSKVYLKENEVLTRKDLLYALMLRSANDAASALSGHNSKEFIKQMNELAKKIGMKNSVFVNASGLDEREYNLSTAYDMALLSSYAAKNKTFVAISSAHEYSCSSKESSYNWHNKHKLVSNDNDFLWGKTGYTKKSRRILVSNYVKESKNVIIVTINDGNDWNHHRALASDNSKYNFVTIFKKGVYDTKKDVTYYIYIPEDIILPIKKNEKEKIQMTFRLYKEYALLDIYLNDVLVLNRKIEVFDKTTFDIDLVIDSFK